MKDVDAEYYGYRDEDDGVLLPLETQYEKQGETIFYSIVGLEERVDRINYVKYINTASVHAHT